MTSYWGGTCEVLSSMPILAKPVGEPQLLEAVLGVVPRNRQRGAAKVAVANSN
jgi:hypothetical protein